MDACKLLLAPHIKKNLEKELEKNPKTGHIMQEHNSNSVESLTHGIHGFPYIFILSLGHTQDKEFTQTSTTTMITSI